MDISVPNNSSVGAKTSRGIHPADATIDITRDVCPMTYVRTRLALDRMAPGQTLLVLLKGEDPRQNVPRTAESQGHTIIDQETDAHGLTRLLLRRG